jgi:hypothetical protein
MERMTQRSMLAAVMAIAILSGCGPSQAPGKPSAQTPAQQPVSPPPAGEPEKSPYPPPPIEIGPGTDSAITWMVNGVAIMSDTSETSARLTDELTWKVETFSVVDGAGVEQTDVTWASILDGATEKALITRVGGQFFWKVDGNTPEVCSKNDVTTKVPACMHNGAAGKCAGIPASLFDIPNVKFRAKYNKGGVDVEDFVKKIKIRGRTCR